MSECDRCGAELTTRSEGNPVGGADPWVHVSFYDHHGREEEYHGAFSLCRDCGEAVFGEVVA